MVQRHQLAGDQAGIFQAVGPPDRQIEPFLHDIDAPVFQIQIQRHLRVAFQECRNGGTDAKQAQRHGRADAQGARRFALHRAQRLLGLLQIIQDARHLLVIARARFGKAHAAGRAVQQPRGHMAFKFGDVLADGGGRQAQLARRRREPALLHDLPEHLQRRQMIH
ncbi:hypothetical protein D3C71_1548230 [compost metagenome]